MNRSPKSHQWLCQSWQIHFWSMLLPRKIWCSNSKIPEDIRVSKPGDDAGFVRKVSLGHCFFFGRGSGQFMTLSWQDSVENVRHLEMMKDSSLKDGIEGIQKMAQHWKSKLRITCITVEMPLQNDGSQSWIVTSRGMNNYEEVASSIGKPVATKQKEQFISSLSSSSTTVMPIDQRQWNDILAVEYVDEESFSFSVSKSMTRTLRHREVDGAMEWNRWLLVSCR